MEKIYVDHAATTPIHPDVIQVIVEKLHGPFGNPSSIHSFGREARLLVDEARTIAAQSIGAKFQEIIFTSGGTEADNLALIGTAFANQQSGKHIITTEIEHHAVLHTCQYLEKNGFEITYLPVNESGTISIDHLQKALREDTILVSIMFANNEIGTIQPIAEIGNLLKDHPAYFHTDAVQAYSILPIDVNQLNIDLLSVSGHKINGPKGIGFLYVRDGVKIVPQFYGGEQERKRRAGTENVVAIAGFAKAIEIFQKKMEQKQSILFELKQTFVQQLDEEGISYYINGDEKNTLPNIVNISFPGTNVEQLLVNLDLAGIAASSGSACTAGSLEPSHVLRALYGKDSERLYNSVRFSFGLGNTVEQMKTLGKRCAQIIRRLTSTK